MRFRLGARPASRRAVCPSGQRHARESGGLGTRRSLVTMAPPTGMLTQGLLDGTPREHWAGYSRISIGEATIEGSTPVAPAFVTPLPGWLSAVFAVAASVAAAK
jgi:hypothetical protein